jgi:hypothetical protein
MSQPGGSQDQLSILMANMIRVHELFNAMQKAGFTEKQALYLIGQVMAAAAQNNSQEKKE